MSTFLRSRFGTIWWIALVAKTILATALPMSNDEAYYWVWGHHPALSYFDHPPFVGWLFTLGTWFESFGNAARLPGVWLGHFTLLIWHRILEKHLSESQKSWWLIFILFSPFLGAGSLIITPDVPLLFFWSLSLLLLLRLIEKPSPGLYLSLGASLGLGFCSKYMIVIFVPIALIWLAFSGTWRKVRWPLVPLTFVAGIAFCFPVIYWNWSNDWASFRFQLDHGLVSQERNWLWPIEYIGGQIGILFPIVFVFSLLRREPRELVFLRYFGWGPLLFFLYTSFKAPVEANWPIMGHPALLSLAFFNMRDMKWLKVTVATWIVALLLVLSEVAFQWLPIHPDNLKTNEFTRFDALIPEAMQDKPLYLGSYQMAASVSYKLRRQIYKLGGLNRKDFYDFIPQSFPEHDRFWVGAEIEMPLPPWVKERGYEVLSSRRLTDKFHLLEVQRRAQGSDR